MPPKKSKKRPVKPPVEKPGFFTRGFRATRDFVVNNLVKLGVPVAVAIALYAAGPMRAVTLLKRLSNRFSEVGKSAISNVKIPSVNVSDYLDTQAELEEFEQKHPSMEDEREARRKQLMLEYGKQSAPILSDLLPREDPYGPPIDLSGFGMKRKPNKWQSFVKRHAKSVAKKHPRATAQQRMRLLSKMYHK